MKNNRSIIIIGVLIILSTIMLFYQFRSQNKNNTSQNNIEIITQTSEESLENEFNVTEETTDEITTTLIVEEETTRHLNNLDQETFNKMELAYKYEREIQFGLDFLNDLFIKDNLTEEELTQYTDEAIAEVLISQKNTVFSTDNVQTIDNITFEVQSEEPLKIRYSIPFKENEELKENQYDLTLEMYPLNIVGFEQVN